MKGMTLFGRSGYFMNISPVQVWAKAAGCVSQHIKFLPPRDTAYTNYFYIKISALFPQNLFKSFL
jgi:hypothetical protein